MHDSCSDSSEAMLGKHGLLWERDNCSIWIRQSVMRGCELQLRWINPCRDNNGPKTRGSAARISGGAQYPARTTQGDGMRPTRVVSLEETRIST
ncbi:hypothetical protein EYF80_028148 [Liparis tanakae]|uniref:Uncharacterized protein n=1 Tax=Liparis tanakae TaxID=230148 RepID=A0A4Z2H9B7_9TELE|nr:hypothetical protein EYF80_028148 [Liparis tanakae]